MPNENPTEEEVQGVWDAAEEILDAAANGDTEGIKKGTKKMVAAGGKNLTKSITIISDTINNAIGKHRERSR